MLTIRNKLLFLDDFNTNIETIEKFLLLGGTKKQTLTELDLVKIINQVLLTDKHAELKSAKFDSFKTIVKSKIDTFKDGQL